MQKRASDSTGAPAKKKAKASGELPPITVRAPAFGQYEFKSWGEFHAYLSLYCDNTAQVTRVRTSTSVVARNIKKKATASERKKAKNNDAEDSAVDDPDIPANWENYTKSIVCILSGKPTGTGAAQRRTNCPFSVRSSIVLITGCGKH